MSLTNMTRVPYRGSWMWVNPDAHHKGEKAWAKAESVYTWAGEPNKSDLIKFDRVPDGPMFTTHADCIAYVRDAYPGEYPSLQEFTFDGEGNWVYVPEPVLKMTEDEQRQAAFWHRPI